MDHSVLESVFSAYQNSKVVVEATILANSSKAFDASLQKLLQLRLPLNDQLLLRRCSQARRQGLDTARLGRIATAKQYLDEARQVIEGNKLTTEGQLVARSFQKAAEAYLDYQNKDFNQARYKLHQALLTDDVLIEQFRYDIMYLHKVQLMHNEMRIDAKCLEFETAVTIGSELLSYLEEQTAIESDLRNSNRELENANYRAISASLFSQIVVEIASILIGLDQPKAIFLLSLLKSHIILNPMGHCSEFPLAHRWLELKYKLLHGDISFFIISVHGFLNEVCSQIPLLWYFVVADLFKLSQEINLPITNRIVSVVKSDSVDWTYLPYKLQVLFSTISS